MVSRNTGFESISMLTLSRISDCPTHATSGDGRRHSDEFEVVEYVGFGLERVLELSRSRNVQGDWEDGMYRSCFRRERRCIYTPGAIHIDVARV